MSYYASAEELCKELGLDLLVRAATNLDALTRHERLSEYATDPLVSGQLYHRVRDVLGGVRSTPGFQKSVLWLAGPSGTVEQLPWAVGLAEQVSRQGLRVYLVGERFGGWGGASVRCEELSHAMRNRLGDSLPDDPVAVGTDVEGVRWIVSRTSDMRTPVEPARDDDWSVFFVDSVPEWGESVPSLPADGVVFVTSFRDHSRSELEEICSRLVSPACLGVVALGPQPEAGQSAAPASLGPRPRSLWDDSRRHETADQKSIETPDRSLSEPVSAEGEVTQTSWADLARSNAGRRKTEVPTPPPPVTPPTSESTRASADRATQNPPGDGAPPVDQTSWGDRIGAKYAPPNSSGRPARAKGPKSSAPPKPQVKRADPPRKPQVPAEAPTASTSESAQASSPPTETPRKLSRRMKREQKRLVQERAIHKIEFVPEDARSAPASRSESARSEKLNVVPPILVVSTDDTGQGGVTKPAPPEDLSPSAAAAAEAAPEETAAEAVGSETPSAASENRRAEVTEEEPRIEELRSDDGSPAADSDVVEPEDDALPDLESHDDRPKAVEPEAAEPEVVEPDAVEPEVVEPEVVEPEAVEPEALDLEPVAAEQGDPESAGIESLDVETRADELPFEESPADLDPFEEAAARRGLASSTGVEVQEARAEASEPETTDERTVALLSMWERENHRRSLPGKIFQRILATLVVLALLAAASWFGYGYWTARNSADTTNPAPTPAGDPEAPESPPTEGSAGADDGQSSNTVLLPSSRSERDEVGAGIESRNGATTLPDLTEVRERLERRREANSVENRIARATSDQQPVDRASTESAPVGIGQDAAPALDSRGGDPGSPPSDASSVVNEVDRADHSGVLPVSSGEAETRVEGLLGEESPAVVVGDEDAQVEETEPNYVVHLSSFRSLEQAELEVARLREASLAPEFVFVEIPGKGSWYRVFVGHFGTFDEARNTAVQLQAEMDLGQIYVVGQGGTGMPVPVGAP